MSTDNAINIALADDHVMFRKGVADLIRNYGTNMSVIIEASNGQELLERIKESKPRPDVCLLDVNMPVLNGYETASKLKEKYPDIRILALSMHDHEHAIINMIRRGASGYVLKSDEPDVLLQAITSVHEKNFYYSELLNNYPSREAIIPKLKDKDFAFLAHCCTDLTYDQIADVMSLSARTIESYREELFKKLGVKSRTGLVLFAMHIGLHNNDSC